VVLTSGDAKVQPETKFRNRPLPQLEKWARELLIWVLEWTRGYLKRKPGFNRILLGSNENKKEQKEYWQKNDSRITD
jgi:hypothetical protein